MSYEKLTCKIYDSGDTYYYDADGKLHRENGPAVERADGSKEWFLNGKKLTKREWKDALNPVKEMTVAEIAKALGHKVKVVE